MNTEPEEAIVINPLDEPVNEKQYTNASVNTSGIDFSKPLDEPSFKPPPIQGKTTDPKKKPDAINPDMNNLSKKDTEMAASAMVKLCLTGYEWLHTLANKGLQISEKKLNTMQSNGELNLNAMIDYDYGKKIRVGDFFKEYNSQVKNMLEVDEEFKEEVTPVMERVFAKRGIGLTDEQLLLFLFGKDIAAKTMIFMQFKTQTNYILKSIAESSLAMNTPPPPKPTPQPTAEDFEPEAKSEPKNDEPIAVEPEEVVVDKRVRKPVKAAKKKTK